MSQQSLSETTTLIVGIINEAKRDIAKNTVTIGTALNRVRESKLYKHYASHVHTFDDFLMDVGLSKSTSYTMMGIAEQFGHLRIEDVSTDRLAKMLPLKLQENEKEEWIAKATDLPARAFADEINVRRGKQASDECHHETLKQVWKCEDCGKFMPD